MDGNDFRTLSEDEQFTYLAGLADGVLIAPAFELQRESDGETWFEACEARENLGQLKGVMDRFLRENPGRWHEPMGALFFTAIAQACGEIPGDPQNR